MFIKQLILNNSLLPHNVCLFYMVDNKFKIKITRHNQFYFTLHKLNPYSCTIQTINIYDILYTFFGTLKVQIVLFIVKEKTLNIYYFGHKLFFRHKT